MTAPGGREPKDAFDARNRFGSLRFAPLTEDLFADYAFDQNKKWFLTGTFVVTLLLSAFFGAMYAFVPQSVPEATTVVPWWLGTIAALVLGRRLAEKASSRYAALLNWTMAAACVAIAAEVSWFATAAGVEHATYTYGLLMVYTICIYALIQLRGMIAVAAGWGTFAAYAWFAFRNGVALQGGILQASSYFVVTNLLGSGISYTIERQDRLFFVTLLNSAEAGYKTDRLLRTVLPERIAERMKRREARIADQCELVTVMFADVSGVAHLAETWDPHALVAMLNRIFGAFDRVALQNGVDKIKTSGGHFLAAAGLQGPLARVPVDGSRAASPVPRRSSPRPRTRGR